MSKKVYCKDCIHLWEEIDCFWSGKTLRVCTFETKTKETALRPITVFPNPLIKNRNNDCPDFKANLFKEISQWIKQLWKKLN